MLFINKALLRALRRCPPRRLPHPGGVAGSTAGRTGPRGGPGFCREPRSSRLTGSPRGGAGKCHAENNLQSRRCASVFPITALWACRFLCVCFFNVAFWEYEASSGRGWMDGMNVGLTSKKKKSKILGQILLMRGEAGVSVYWGSYSGLGSSISPRSPELLEPLGQLVWLWVGCTESRSDWWKSRARVWKGRGGCGA